MTLKITFFAILLLMLCGWHGALAQKLDAVTDSVMKKVGYYSGKKASVPMFVHMDKTVYVANEVMWFTAYVLNHPAVNYRPKHQVLSAALINNTDQSIAVQGKFVMDKGLSFGNLTIPDSIPAGNYNFIAYTNQLLNGKPAAYFVQPITIKTVEQPNFNVTLALDTLYKDPQTLRAILQADIKSRPLENATITYYLGKGQKTGLTGKAKTNVLGNYMVMIPKNRVTAAQHTLEVNVKYGKEIKTLYLAIPIKQRLTDVKFYPEGGQLVNGLPNRIGWEVKTATGTAIKTQAVVYAGDQPADTIETDSFGMGRFNLTPTDRSIYTVRLLPQATGDSVYKLPPVMPDGVVMRIQNSLPNDTLKMVLKSKYAGSYYVLAHNYRQLFAAVKVMAYPQGRVIKVDLAEIPRGLNTITVLDSLQRPLAERMFFAHYDQQPRLTITNDNKETLTREKMSVKIKLNGVNGKPISGLVSVACVQDNRFEAKNSNNITQYFYLQNEIDDLPLKDDLLGSTGVDRTYLEELLLVRGWSKYKWPELQEASPADTLLKQDSLIYNGSITLFESKLKKPVQVVLMADSLNMQLLNSTDKGLFTLANTDIYSKPDKKINMLVSGNSDNYTITITDPYIAYNKTLATGIMAIRYEAPLTQNTQEFVVRGFEHATNLREVKINASNSKFLNGPMPGRIGLAAFGGDYICRYGILNCSNHPNDPGNRPVMNGQMVNIPGRGYTIYHSQNPEPVKKGVLSFTGIYAAKEFYGADYTKINPTEPDYLSTLYWKHSLIITPGKEAEISFYTSDITGKFRIVVQGITNEDVVYGEDTFTVKKKPAGK